MDEPATGPRRETRDLLRLAGPLLANNIALAGISFSDTVMAGRIGARDLAAVALGNGIYILVFMTGLGILMAMNPMAAHSLGDGRPAELGRTVRQCLWLSQAMAILGWCALLGAAPFMSLIGVDPAVVPLAADYLFALSFGLPGIFAYLALRFTSEGIGHTRPIMYMALIGLVVNVAGNYVLMYGKLGFPALGAVGCGISSAIALWTMFAGMLRYVVRSPVYRPFEFFARLDWPDLARIREILTLGLPIGMAVLAEIGLFAAVSLLMGTLGAVVVAGHQIAINYASTMFMVPLALHSAMTIRVGQFAGRGDLVGARRVGLLGIYIVAGFMSLSAVVLLIFRHTIVGFYTTDAAAAAVAVSLLGVAAIFQVADGIQIGAAGALRGLKDTRVPMLLNIFAYWVIGFPLAYGLGIAMNLGPRWVWAGFVAGLGVGAIALTLRFLAVTRASAQTILVGRE